MEGLPPQEVGAEGVGWGLGALNLNSEIVFTPKKIKYQLGAFLSLLIKYRCIVATIWPYSLGLTID